MTVSFRFVIDRFNSSVWQVRVYYIKLSLLNIKQNIDAVKNGYRPIDIRMRASL